MWLPANSLTTVVHLAGPRRRVDNAPNKVLADLLDDVLQGLRSVWEASAAYGASYGKGRPRKFRAFADYLADRVRHAEDQANERELRRLLMASVSARGASQARSAMTMRINRLLDETGSERAARLRELLADLGEPVRGNG